MLLVNLVINKLDSWQMYSGPCSSEFNIDMRQHIDLKKWNQEHYSEGKKKKVKKALYQILEKQTIMIFKTNSF